MRSRYRLVRFQNARGAFAEMEINTTEGEFQIEWEPSMGLRKGYEKEVVAGITDAYERHRARGRNEKCFCVFDLIDFTVDTRPSHVACAAYAAAWGAPGHDTERMLFERTDEGEWRVNSSDIE